MRESSEIGHQQYEVMKEFTPELYEEIMGNLVEIVRRAHAGEEVSQAGIARMVRQSTDAYVSARLSSLSDDGVVTFNGLAIQQFDVLHDLQLGNVCAAIFMGTPFGSLPTSERLLEIETEILRTVGADPLDGTETVTQEEYQQIFETAVALFQDRVSDEEFENVFGLIAGQVVSNYNMCSNVSLFSHAMLEAAGDRTGPFFRTIYQIEA
jgi:hypothetical protein